MKVKIIMIFNSNSVSWQDLETKANKILKTEITTNNTVTQELNSNQIYHFTGNNITSLTISLATQNQNEAAHYHFDFSSGASELNLILPSSVEIALEGTVNGSNKTYILPSNTKYEIDILDNLGIITEY